MDYQNKQIGTALLMSMGGVAVFIVLMSLGKGNSAIWLSLSVLALTSFLFYSLNITVDNSHVNWSFGPGFWKKSLPLERIQSVSIVQTKWYYGLGIRHIASGWLYTVSGTTAIKLTLKGGTSIYLGTNDADQLMQVIDSRLASDTYR